MSLDFYDKALEGIFKDEIELATHPVKALALGSGYVRNLTTDKFRSIIPGGEVFSMSAALTGIVFSGRHFSFDPFSFLAVPAGPDITQIVLYTDRSGAGADRLIANWNSGTGFPITPNGTDINITVGNIGVARAV